MQGTDKVFPAKSSFFENCMTNKMGNWTKFGHFLPCQIVANVVFGNVYSHLHIIEKKKIITFFYSEVSEMVAKKLKPELT